MAFRIYLDDPRLLDEFVDTFHRAECEAELVDGTVVVDVPRAPDRTQAKRELSLYLAVWRARHPGSVARFLDDGD